MLRKQIKVGKTIFESNCLKHLLKGKPSRAQKKGQRISGDRPHGYFSEWPGLKEKLIGVAKLLLTGHLADWRHEAGVKNQEPGKQSGGSKSLERRRRLEEVFAARQDRVDVAGCEGVETSRQKPGNRPGINLKTLKTHETA